MNTPDKTSAEEWIKNLKKGAEIRAQTSMIAKFLGGLKSLVQSGIDELTNAGMSDSNGGANLDVARQVITEIENRVKQIDEVNNH